MSTLWGQVGNSEQEFDSSRTVLFFLAWRGFSFGTWHRTILEVGLGIFPMACTSIQINKGIARPASSLSLQANDA